MAARPPPPARGAPSRRCGALAAALGAAVLAAALSVTVTVTLLLPPDPTDAPMVTPAPLVGQPGRLELLQAPRGDKPAAHVVASASPSGGSLRWDSSVAPALMRNGVRLLGNRLVVPRDGLYFVYAAAAFQGGPCPPRAPPGPPLRLWVSRFSQEYPRDVPLLSAARSVCRGGGGATGPSVGTRVNGAFGSSRSTKAPCSSCAAGTNWRPRPRPGGSWTCTGAGGAYFGVVGVD